MQRTTIMLPPDLKAKAQRLAKERGISFGEFLRESLAAAMEAATVDKRAGDPLFADEAVWEGEAPADLSQDHDRYLYEESGKR